MKRILFLLLLLSAGPALAQQVESKQRLQVTKTFTGPRVSNCTTNMTAPQFVGSLCFDTSYDSDGNGQPGPGSYYQCVAVNTAAVCTQWTLLAGSGGGGGGVTPAGANADIQIKSGSNLAAYPGTSCTAQFPRALSSAGVATCAKVDLSSDTAATTLPLAKLTDDASSGKCLLSGGGGGDPNWATCPSGGGTGDMTKAVYDTNADSTVDNAAKLGGQLPAYYAVDGSVVHTSGTEIVAGDKQFTGATTFGSGGMTAAQVAFTSNGYTSSIQENTAGTMYVTNTNGINYSASIHQFLTGQVWLNSVPLKLSNTTFSSSNSIATAIDAAFNLGGKLVTMPAATGAAITSQCATWDSNGNLVGTGSACAGSAYYQTVQNNGSAVTQRGTINFIPGTGSGTIISCVDNGGSTRTDCTVNAVTGSGANTRLAYWNAASTQTSDANLTWNGTQLSIANSSCSGSCGVSVNYNSGTPTNSTASTVAIGSDNAGILYSVTNGGTAFPLNKRTESSAINLLAPAAGDSGKLGFEIPSAATLTRVYCATDQGTVQGLQLVKRAEPGFSGGSNTLTAADCTPTGVSYTITSSAITARDFLVGTWTGVSNSPTALPTAVHIIVEYTIQ